MREQDVVLDQRERLVGVLCGVQTAVVEVQRGAVVDQPQPVVPEQQVGVARGAIDVGGERVEPHDVGGESVLRRVWAGGRVRERAREEVHAEVRAGAGRDQLLDLGVGLRRAEHGIDLDSDQVGHEQAEPAREFADDDLGDERPQALAGAAELDHVQAVVVGLDKPGERPTLAQRGDVTDRGDVAEAQVGGSRHGRHGTAPRGPFPVREQYALAPRPRCGEVGRGGAKPTLTALPPVNSCSATPCVVNPTLAARVPVECGVSPRRRGSRRPPIGCPGARQATPGSRTGAASAR